jgi:ribonuclease-3
MRKLGYKFRNQNLLIAALTHRSVRGPNNERLEFLGDSLLNFIIAAELYTLFDKAKEGELSRFRAILVKGETLAAIAQEFQIGDYLRLGPGELKSGGFTRKSILADAFEAIIGAIFLDSGFDTCRERVLHWFASRINEIHLHVEKDPKTRLQEYLQAKKISLPHYHIVTVEGQAHAQVFHIECRVPGFSYVTYSVGTSRRSAEQLAAEKFLELLFKG